MIKTYVQKPDNYGMIQQGGYAPATIPDMLLKAAEVFHAQSGKFVKMDGTDDVAVAGSGDTQLVGWALVQGVTGSIDGYTVPASTKPHRVDVVKDINARFIMPADAAVTEAIKNLTCDLIVAAEIQYADIGESNEDVIMIYDINVALQLVEVGLSPIKLFTAGVV